MKSINATKFGLTIATLVLFAACASLSQSLLSDGTVAYRIDCDGTAAGMNYCFERAGKSCGAAGYVIVDQDGRTLSQSSAADTDIDALVRIDEADQNSILFRCNTGQRLAERSQQGSATS